MMIEIFEKSVKIQFKIAAFRIRNNASRTRLKIFERPAKIHASQVPQRTRASFLGLGD